MIQALASRGVTNGRDPLASRSRGGRASDPVRAGEGRGRRTIRSNASGAGAGRPEPASPGHRRTDEPRTSASGSNRPSRAVLHPDLSSPAGARATARFDLPRTIPVTVHVFDIAGRRVQEFPYGLLDAGPQHLSWDVSALPSGLYFVQVQAGAATGSGKFVVVH